MECSVRLFKDQVQRVCIKHDWYTCGHSGHYAEMLEFAAEKSYNDLQAWTNHLKVIAEDILLHSETDAELGEVMYALNKAAWWHFED